MPFQRLLGPALAFSFTGATSLLGYSVLSGNEHFYTEYLMPTIHKVFDPEEAHRLAIQLAKYGLVPKEHHIADEEKFLKVHAFNRSFKNPIGCAAGFDKNGEAMHGLYKIGFGFVEIGTITPLAQEGNPKPRVFRLSEDKAVINRYGFNNDGHGKVLDRVKSFKEDSYRNVHKILGINIGKNKLAQDAIKDYLDGLRCFGTYADYIVINISSPNTPGLRSLQNKEQLEQLIDPILELRDDMRKNLPIIIKIAPDLNDQEMKDIAEVVTRKDKKVDGLIVSNTTIERPTHLKCKNKKESGGLSGRPLKELSNKTLRRMYELTNGKVTLIGSGGIESGKDALERIKSGATLIQIYTSMIYDGPVVVNKIKRELIDELREQGFSNVSEAIGVDFKPKSN